MGIGFDAIVVFSVPPMLHNRVTDFPSNRPSGGRRDRKGFSFFEGDAVDFFPSFFSACGQPGIIRDDGSRLQSMDHLVDFFGKGDSLGESPSPIKPEPSDFPITGAKDFDGTF